MTNETLRMQFLSGVITEGQYKNMLNENTKHIELKSLEDILLKNGYKFAKDDAGFSGKATYEKKVNDLNTYEISLFKDYEGSPVRILYFVGEDYTFSNGKKMNRGQADISYDSIDDAKQDIEGISKINTAKQDSLNESMIGGIVGIGAINQIPPRAKADYETAFEHFLGKKYGLNEVEIEEVEELEEGKEEVDSRIKNDANFQKLVAYLKQNPDEAEDVNDELKTLKEDWIKTDGKSSTGYRMLDGVYSTYVYFKDNKYYKEQSLPGGRSKTDEISKEEFQKIQKEYWKDKLVKIGLGASAVGFVGALMAGPFGANDPGGMLEAALIAAGFGGAAASIFE